jgi:hypothetical protein
MFDTQRPIPFRHGLDAKRLRPGPPPAGTCPKCGCTPEGPRCPVKLEDGGAGVCLPAGTFGAKTCSACVALLVALVAVFCLACGPAFTLEQATPAADDAGDAGELVDAIPAAGDGASHVEASAADVDAGELLDGLATSADAGDVEALSDAGPERDAPSEIDHDAPDVGPPPVCHPSSCPACPALYVACCTSGGACGCSSSFSLCH